MPTPPTPLPTSGIRKVIINFTPSWFTVVMGTGILSILIKTMPHQFYGQSTIATIFYILNIVLFLTFFLISIARYALYPWVWMLMLRHNTQSLFLGTFPMGLATIINATVLIAVPTYGDWARDLSWALWWIDVVISVLSCFGLPMVMFHLHQHSLDKMTAVWLLPIVPTVVAAASGGVVSTVLPPDRAYITILVSYALWGVGMSLSFLVMAIYLHRLIVHKLPNSEVIVSAFLPLGPLGQGSYGLMKLAESGRVVFPLVGFTVIPGAGDMIYAMSVVMTLILWGFGFWWLVHGISSVSIRAAAAPLKHNMGFWGFIFPLGTYTSSTMILGEVVPSEFFNYLSIVFLVALVILYLYVMYGLIRGLATGTLLHAPYLSEFVSDVSASPTGSTPQAEKDDAKQKEDPEDPEQEKIAVD